MIDKSKMSPEEYLSDTKHAVEQLFNILGYYSDILKDIDPPVFMTDTTDEEQWSREFEEWERRNKDAIQRSFKKEKEYLGYSISKDTICGSILQVAYMGVRTFSTNKDVLSSCKGLANINRAAKFCVGRKVRGLPIGLIIYAGRNQCNHIDEQEYLEPTKEIFELLATDGKHYRDPAFDLKSRQLFNYAGNITAILEWRTYEKYFQDMRSLIQNGNVDGS